jgi:polar amino acid transport system permease protein
MYQFDWSAVYDPELWLEGAKVTLIYAIGTTVIGSAVGLICGIGLISGRFWLRLPINIYVQAFRCTPLLIQIVWFYYALPMLVGYSLPAWLAAGIGLTLYMGAFCAEIFRAGVISIEKGQWQASEALGMNYRKMMWHIILPQAIRRMVPPVVNQSVIQLKNTSLLYVVAVPDIMYASSQLTSITYRPLEVYTSLAFCISSYSSR